MLLNAEQFRDAILENPIIAAVNNETSLGRALESECRVLFFLCGKVYNIASLVAQAKDAQKICFVHMDLIDGLSGKDEAVDFISLTTRADGILSTKASQIKHAKQLHLLAIQRFFILDSISLLNISKQLSTTQADVVEVLPGIMPKVIRRIQSELSIPLIAGGLISDKEDVMHALQAGASAISSTNPSVWYL